jgi:hypothetical protein
MSNQKNHSKEREIESFIPLRRDDGERVSETSEFYSVSARLMVTGEDFILFRN